MTKPRIPPRTSQRFARRGENEWRRLIERQRVSGLTQAAFCERESVSLVASHALPQSGDQIWTD